MALRRGDRGIIAALFIGALLLYIPILSNDFVGYDDPIYVTENPAVWGGLSWTSIVWAFTTTHFANWLPVTWLSHLLDVSLFGLEAGGHHATSAVLHAANVAMLYAALRMMTGWRGPSLAATLLFAVHPLRVESVAWVAERKDVLAATFALVTLLAYIRYIKKPTIGRYLPVAVALALGLMSKTMLVTWPAVLLLVDYWPLRRIGKAGPIGVEESGLPRVSLRRALLEKVPLLLLALVASAWTVVLQKTGGSMEVAERLALGQRVGNAFVAIPRYLGKIVFPTALVPFYPHPGSWPIWAIAASVAVLLILSALVWVVRRRAPYAVVGWLWFLGMLLPVIGIVQVGGQSIADRYTYLPGIGLTVAVVWGVTMLLRVRPVATKGVLAGLCVLLVIFAAGSVWQQTRWRDTRTLFEHTLKVDPDNYIAQVMVGTDLQRRNQDEEAIPHLRRSIELNPLQAHGSLALGRSLQKTGRLQEAIPAYQAVTKLNPNWALPRIWLASTLSDLGRYAEADAEFEQAARIGPDEPILYIESAVSLTTRGDHRAAYRMAEHAVRLNPSDANARTLLEQIGRRVAAVQRTTRPAH